MKPLIFALIVVLFGCNTVKNIGYYKPSGYIKNDSVLMVWIGPVKHSPPYTWKFMYDVYYEL